MNTVSLSISQLGSRLVLLGVLIVLGLYAGWLLASVAIGSLEAVAPIREGPLLAPFRWSPRADTLG